MKKLVILCLTMMLAVSFSFMACGGSKSSDNNRAPALVTSGTPGGAKKPKGTKGTKGTEETGETGETVAQIYANAAKLEGVEFKTGDVLEYYGDSKDDTKTRSVGLIFVLNDEEDYCSLDENVPYSSNSRSVDLMDGYKISSGLKFDGISIELFVTCKGIGDMQKVRISLQNSMKNAIEVEQGEKFKFEKVGYISTAVKIVKLPK